MNMSRACQSWGREILWDEDRWSSEDSGRWASLGAEHMPAIRTPTPSYSKRSNMQAQLRARRGWAIANSDDDIRPPSDRAFEAAKGFINNLPDGCLTMRLAISQGGEINFFAGAAPHLLQILIDDEGELSYYGESADSVLAADSVAVTEFPYLRLFRFL